jgi:putative FmdB family regulatory protein
MPEYVYECQFCGSTTTIKRPVEMRELDACPVCNSLAVHRVFTPPAITTTDQPRQHTLDNGDHRVEVLRDDGPGMAGFVDHHADGSKATTITPFGSPDSLPPNVEVHSP